MPALRVQPNKPTQYFVRAVYRYIVGDHDLAAFWLGQAVEHVRQSEAMWRRFTEETPFSRGWVDAASLAR